MATYLHPGLRKKTLSAFFGCSISNARLCARLLLEQSVTMRMIVRNAGNVSNVWSTCRNNPNVNHPLSPFSTQNVRVSNMVAPAKKCIEVSK